MKCATQFLPTFHVGTGTIKPKRSEGAARAQMVEGVAPRPAINAI